MVGLATSSSHACFPFNRNPSDYFLVASLRRVAVLVNVQT